MDEQKHAGLGIASFVTSIAAGISIFLLIVIAGVMKVSSRGEVEEDSAGAVIIGLSLFAFLAVTLVALGLGIAGLMQKDRKKIFAILGIAFSAVSLLGTIFLILLGLALG